MKKNMSKRGPYRPAKPGARKYVAFKDGSVATSKTTVSHSTVAKKHGGTPVAGGYYRKKDGKVKVIGYSHSLGLDPRKKDAKKIERKRGRK